MKNIFEWLSKHFSILGAITTLVVLPVLYFLYPFLITSVCLEPWLIILISFIPFLLLKTYNFYYSVKKRKFKGGERVVFAHTAGFDANYVNGYSLFHAKKVVVKNLKNEIITVHEDSLELFDPERHAQIL